MVILENGLNDKITYQQVSADLYNLTKCHEATYDLDYELKQIKIN